MPISRILPSHFCIFFCGFSLWPRDAHCFAASSDLPQLGIVSRRRQSGTHRAFFLPPCLSMSLSATFSLHTQLKSWPFKKPFKKADTALFAQMTFLAINGTDIFSQPLPTLGAKWLKRNTSVLALGIQSEESSGEGGCDEKGGRKVRRRDRTLLPETGHAEKEKRCQQTGSTPLPVTGCWEDADPSRHGPATHTGISTWIYICTCIFK